MPQCPNCDAEVVADAKACHACNADFTDDHGWRPGGVGTKAAPRPGATTTSNKAADVVMSLAAISVAVPLVAFAVGALAVWLIPGCKCDEGAGCVGCGANALVSLLFLGGLAGTLGAVTLVLPFCIVLALIFSVFS